MTTRLSQVCHPHDHGKHHAHITHLGCAEGRLDLGNDFSHFANILSSFRIKKVSVLFSGNLGLRWIIMQQNILIKGDQQ